MPISEPPSNDAKGVNSVVYIYENVLSDSQRHTAPNILMLGKVTVGDNVTLMYIFYIHYV